MFYPKNINLLINLLELKYRLFYYLICFLFTFFICFYYKVELFFSISSIFLSYHKGFIYTNLIEPFIVYLQLSLLFTIFFTLPFFIYCFSFFFFKAFPNFYTIYYFFFFILMYLLMIFFFIFSLIMLFPFFLEFLFSFQRINSFEMYKLALQATMVQYYNFFFAYIIFYLLIILIPNIFLISIFLNLINKEILIQSKFRIYLYCSTLILFLIFAPPDIIIQLIFLPFLIFIIEIFLYFVYFFFILYYI